MTTLHIPGEPPTTTSQGKGVRIAPHNGTMKAFFYKKKAYKDAERHYLQMIPRGKPYAGPVGVQIHLQWEWRKAEPKKNRITGWAHKITKPDLDNSAKLILDAMEMRQFGFSHDAQIARLEVSKTWGDESFTRISVWSLDDDETWVNKNTQNQNNHE